MMIGNCDFCLEVIDDEVEPDIYEEEDVLAHGDCSETAGIIS